MARKRKLVITEQMRAIVEEQLRRFREKFGREPRLKDPVFFDPDCDEPVELPLDKLTAAAAAVMAKAGMPPEVIYAYLKTGGLLITEDSRHLWSAEDLARWDEAVQGYFTRRDLQ